MQYSSVVLIAAFAATNVFAHGVITSVQGGNGVTMAGLSVIDGTPRDSPNPNSGSEADTSIIRAKEAGTAKASALGRTANGPVSADAAVAMFMGGAANTTARDLHAANLQRRFLVPRQANGGTKTPKGTVEAGVGAGAGTGATSGLPTTNDDGSVTMTFHQVNQDGAGPLTASVDPTSGGTDPAAFQDAQVTQNVPGIGIGGLSQAQTTDFPVTMQMPAGMTCTGTAGGASNVCVAKLQNKAAAGPFGGSVAFTQSAAAMKRAIEHNLSKRRFAKALAARAEPVERAAAAASKAPKARAVERAAAAASKAPKARAVERAAAAASKAPKARAVERAAAAASKAPKARAVERAAAAASKAPKA